jgi:hypothetical protein
MPDLHRWINPTWLERADAQTAWFQSAKPFKHLVLDDFFLPEQAEALLKAFPSFASGNHLNEAGLAGGKSVVEDLSRLPTPYSDLDQLLKSTAWLGFVAQLTGIPDLLFDPHYFGGGTHDNRAGQELDPHVDFNKHPVTGSHRRLNLIVYLNHNWQPEFGGQLELYENPREAGRLLKRIAPNFNRCVIFETTEWSWHAFDKIVLPEGDNRTRKSIAVYLYSHTRPDEELAKPHSTIYVDRAPPSHWRAGHTFSLEDENALQVHIARRDQHVQRLYRDLANLSEQLEQARAAATPRGLLRRVRDRVRRIWA